MPTWLIVILAVLALLALGGALGRRRQMHRSRHRFDANLLQVNRDLASAHAEDRGWDRATLDEAARAAYSEQRPGADPGELVLMQVIDRPGTDEDKAVYRFGSVGAYERLTLGRRDGGWVFESNVAEGESLRDSPGR
jgi:MYXO-CTERM domain-containing protein